MLILILGGSGSGKSAYAEKKALELAGTGKTKYYLATMAVHDEEMRQKVRRHQRIRRGRGWITLDDPVDAGRAATEIQKNSVVLLEDLGNLTANEMFRESGSAGLRAEKVCRKIDDELRALEQQAGALIVVSNEVFSDGAEYDPGTVEYIRALGMLHRRLAVRADEVTEVVAGVPVKRETGSRDGFSKDPGSRSSRDCTAQEQREMMEIVIGGRAQGKLDMAKSEHPDFEVLDGGSILLSDFQSPDIRDNPSMKGMILNHTHLLVRRMLAAGLTQDEIMKQLKGFAAAQQMTVFVSDEIGCGIVPLEAEERRWREVTGRVLTSLAEEAGLVERVTCGIRQILKQS